MIDDLQLRYERAQDAIGTYIEELSAALSAEAVQQRALSVDGLAINYWLKEEVHTAGLERAKLFEYRRVPNALEALVQLYEQKLFALSQAQQRIKHQSAAQDTSFLRSVLDASRHQTA